MLSDYYLWYIHRYSLRNTDTLIPSIISSSFSRQSTLKRNSEYRKDEEGYEYEYEYEYEEVLEFNDNNDDGYEVGRR